MDAKENLYQNLAVSLRKAERGRKAVAVLKIPVYSLTLVFFCFIAFNLFSMGRFAGEYHHFNLTGWMVGVVFAVFFFQFFFFRALSYFSEKEAESMRLIVKNLYPDAKFRMPYHGVTYQVLKKSRLFTGFNRDGNLPATNFAGIETTVGGRKLNIADIGISTGKSERAMANIPILGQFYFMFKMILKPLFSRPDRAVYDFRGMLAWAEFEKEFKGRVLILPDKLEQSLGHMAQAIQSMKNVDGSRLVVMEDPEFENYFAVYADDEVAARYILTPAVMRKITALKEKFGRDMLLSFNGNGFYFAVSMPEGFLAVRPSGLRGKSLIDEIDEDIRTACETLNELNTINK